MQKRRVTLLTALVFSVLLHFVLVAGGEIVLPDFYTPPDEVLERKKATRIQRVQIVSNPSASPAKAAGIRFASARKATTLPRKIAKKKELSEKPAAPTELAGAETASAENTAPAETIIETPAPPSAPPPEPAPAFPIQINAVLEARYNGISFTIRQTWMMEGFRYAIDQNAKRFGFHFQISSEGRIAPEGGLSPEHYALKVNSKVRSSCHYADGEIHYGKTTGTKSVPLPVTPQDMASLPFHVAVTFNGQSQSIFVCTGNSVYQVRLFVDAEETLKLPTGTVRTLHLLGERFDPKLGQMVTGYEVWLAPDYLNYPVKFIGHTSNGDRFEYRVKELVLEGKRVLGEKSNDSEEPADDATPDWIRQRAASESLSNP